MRGPDHAEGTLTPMDALAVEQGRRTEAERRVCSQTGCPGDGRYQPPGRGHLPDCPHNAMTWSWEQINPPAEGAVLSDEEHNEHGELAGRLNWDRTVYTEEAVNAILAARAALPDSRTPHDRERCPRCHRPDQDHPHTGCPGRCTTVTGSGQ